MQQFDLTPMAELLTKDANPDCFAALLDDACFNIASQSIANQNQVGYGDAMEQLFYLRKLRDTMVAIGRQCTR